MRASVFFLFFFFNDTAPTEIYTLSLHDALPIRPRRQHDRPLPCRLGPERAGEVRSEEHTSELQSRENLGCRLLLEKKKKNNIPSPRGQKNTSLHKVKPK